MACITDRPIVLEDVRRADVVAEALLLRYEIVRDQEALQQRARLMDAYPRLRRMLRNSKGTLHDYARLEFRVLSVLRGQAPEHLTVTWDNSTFREPEQMRLGRYLVALRKAFHPFPPLRGPSATVLRTPEPALMTVLQAPCAPAFLFEIPSDGADTVRRMLDSR